MVKHLVVVGGTAGIGGAVALACLAGGWRVTVTSRGACPQGLGDAGAAHAVLDLGAAVQVHDVLSALAPDALVVAAGPFHRVPLLDESDDGWRHLLSTNLDGVFFAARAVLPAMRRRGWGRLVTFGVANAERLPATPEVAAWMAAKAGLVTLTRSLGRVGAPDGVTANMVSPGFIDTGAQGRAVASQVGPDLPAGRLGTVDEVVEVVAFLLSDGAAYVNGANVVVSGGWGF